MTNDDGDVIYEGEGSVQERTGSNLGQLITYILKNKSDKPIDVDQFRDYLINDLKIPPSELLYKPWKKLRQ